MKKTIVTLSLVAGLTAMYTGSVFAEGSTVTGSNVTNDATISNSRNTATGTGGGFLGIGAKPSEANQGAVKISNSSVRNSTVSNRANVRNSYNTAKDGARANQGSILVE